MSISVFLPAVTVGTFYKVPHGQELPYAGRWLKATHIWPGAVDFDAAGGHYLRLSRTAAERLVEHATATRTTAPATFR